MFLYSSKMNPDWHKSIIFYRLVSILFATVFVSLAACSGSNTPGSTTSSEDYVETGDLAAIQKRGVIRALRPRM